MLRRVRAMLLVLQCSRSCACVRLWLVFYHLQCHKTRADSGRCKNGFAAAAGGQCVRGPAHVAKACSAAAPPQARMQRLCNATLALYSSPWHDRGMPALLFRHTGLRSPA